MRVRPAAWTVAIWTAALTPAVAGGDDPPKVELQPGEGAVAWVLASEEGFDGGLAVSPDGKRIAAAADEWMFILEAATGAVQRTFEVEGSRCKSVAWAPDGRRLAVGTRDGIRCVDANTGQELWCGTGHPDDVPATARGRYPQPEFGISHAVAWNGDGTRVATTTREVTSVRWLDGSDGSKVQDIEMGFEGMTRFATTPDGSVLVVIADDGPLAAINWPDSTLRWKVPGRHEPALAISDDSRFVVCGSGGGSAGSVHVHNSGDGSLVRSYSPVGDFDIGGVAFNADASAFVAAGGGNGLSPLVHWPLASKHRPSLVWHKNYPVEGLVRAGNLIVAAGDRVDELRAFRLP